MNIKKISLLGLIICLSANLTLAQKAKVQTAYNFYKEPYQQFDKAKEAIDEAILNESSSTMAKTWYYRGLIYESLHGSAKYGNLCDNCLVTAFESFKKAMQLDPKNEWAEEIKVKFGSLTNTIFSEGVKAFKEQKFDQALNSFETLERLAPGDTSVILNSAYSAERAGQTDKAKKYYSTLAGMKYSDEKVYLSLSNLYKASGDTAKALETIREGQKIKPESINLKLSEINILLSTGRNAEATQALDAAIARDPKNPNLYLALGSTYENLAQPKGGAKSKDYTTYMAKASESYQKGLEIAQDNYELNYNLGAFYFNEGADINNQAKDIKDNAAYEKMKAKSDDKFKQAQPYLEKALEKNPKKTDDDMNLYKGTLLSLKQLYVRTGQTEKYNQVKQLLEAK